MSILTALTLAQLQTFNHILTEMESTGLLSLPEARLVVSRETDLRHKHRQSKQYTPPKIQTVLCPECGQIMVKITVDTLEIMECKCWYSEIMVVGDD